MTKDEREIMNLLSNELRELRLALTCNPTDQAFMDGQNPGLLYQIINSNSHDAQGIVEALEAQQAERRVWLKEDRESSKAGNRAVNNKIVTYMVIRSTINLGIFGALVWLILK